MQKAAIGKIRVEIVNANAAPYINLPEVRLLQSNGIILKLSYHEKQ